MVKKPKKDHPDQAIDTELPDDHVDMDAFEALRAEFGNEED